MIQRTFFQVCFGEEIRSVSDVWAIFADFLRRANLLPDAITLSGITGHSDENCARRGDKPLIFSPGEISAVIERRRLNGFSVEMGSLEGRAVFTLQSTWDGMNRASSLSKFWSYSGQAAQVPQDWKRMIESVLVRWRAIGAWQYPVPYQAWQSMGVLSEIYEQLYGLLPPGFSTYPDPGYDPSSDIGPQRTLIDISMNPGRPKILVPGMSFYPTAEMWLGPHFWQYAKCTKEEALAADFWLETRDTPHYTYFKCWPTPFTRPDGEQGRMQQRLWQLFFNEDCEWPPGSGTICDEPMYGPLELWPAGLDYPYPTGLKA